MTAQITKQAAKARNALMVKNSRIGRILSLYRTSTGTNLNESGMNEEESKLFFRLQVKKPKDIRGKLILNYSLKGRETLFLPARGSSRNCMPRLVLNAMSRQASWSR